MRTVRTAYQIVRDARRAIAARNDDKEYISPEEAHLLAEEGATDFSTSQQSDGSSRIDFEFQGVRFVTVRRL